MPEPVIETLEDWNARLAQCGCCPMPSCLTPTKECETNWVRYSPSYAEGYQLVGKWKTADWYCYDVDDNYITGTSNFRGFNRVENPCGVIGPAGLDPAYADGTNAGCSYDFTWIADSGMNEWSVPVFIADISADAETYLTFPPPDTEPASCAYASTSCASSLYAGELEGGVTKVRYRWKIPDEHLGTYFKITWDILNEPTGWNTTTLLRTYYLEDQTYEWTGAAGGGTDRYSSWITIPVPDFVGQRRIVNIRYECYRTTDYGNKPQVTGEAVILPDT